VLIIFHVNKLDPCVTLHNIVLAWGISIASDVLQRYETVGRVSFKWNLQTTLQFFSFEIENIEVGVFPEAEEEQGAA